MSVLHLTTASIAIAAAFAITLTTRADCPQSYTFTLIADDTRELTLDVGLGGGLPVAERIWPAVAGNGTVVFRSALDSGGEGLFIGNGGFGPVPVVLSRDADPDSDFLSFDWPPVIRSTGSSVEIAFFASYHPPEAPFPSHGIFRANTANDGIVVALPDELDPKSPYNGVSPDLDIRPNGDVVFVAALNSPGQPAAIAEGGAGSVPGQTFILTDSDLLDVTGFTGIAVASGVDHIAVQSSAISTPFEPLNHRFIDGIGFQPLGTWNGLPPGLPSIDSGGAIAFRQPGAAADEIHVVGTDSIVHVYVNDARDGLVLNLTRATPIGNGCVNFMAEDDEFFTDGLYAADDDSIGVVLQEPDELLDNFAVNIQLSKHAVNSAGQIAFYAELFDGRRVIVRADPVGGPVDLPGDLNGDEMVNAADLAILLGAWTLPGNKNGACDGEIPCPPDLNRDGFVNAADLAILLGAWTL